MKRHTEWNDYMKRYYRGETGTDNLYVWTYLKGQFFNDGLQPEEVFRLKHPITSLVFRKEGYVMFGYRQGELIVRGYSKNKLNGVLDQFWQWPGSSSVDRDNTKVTFLLK